MRSSISSGKNGNVTAQDDTSILFSFGDTIQIPSGEELSISDSNLIRKYNLESHYHDYDGHDYFHASIGPTLSLYKEHAISYIAGFTVRMARKKLLCQTCRESLESSTYNNRNSFLQFKNHGGLVKPSKSVEIVCQEVEKCIERMMSVTNGKLPQGMFSFFSFFKVKR